ncbi:hypothetical protein HON36_00740 [Candidatus Parcubacteria bacterium]|jgi:hypothetical protein|nr:hypothetical protein [Candidatus Parcubacteria bacterium]
MKKLFLITTLLAIAIPIASLAGLGVGVGVGTGKIDLDKNLQAGDTYQLEAVQVLNTGSDPVDFQMSVSFSDSAEELQPDESWIKFDPEIFFLEAGDKREVNIFLDLPTDAKEGDYFAFLEATPITQGGLKISAAVKLYFTIETREEQIDAPSKPIYPNNERQNDKRQMMPSAPNVIHLDDSGEEDPLVFQQDPVQDSNTKMLYFMLGIFIVVILGAFIIYVVAERKE